MASPRTRLWDAAWTAYTWIPLHPDHPGFSLEGSAERLRAFCADYGGLSPVDVFDTLLLRLRFSAEFGREQAASGDPGFQKLEYELDSPRLMERRAEQLHQGGFLRRLLGARA